LVDLASGQPLEMGTPFDTFSEAAHTANATGLARTNRGRLVRAMEREGWTNYAQEWWHFTFKVSNPVPFDRVIR
ncbi:MAG TPA: M15 family metallopeptidase, partial [Gemmatimonadales bacterium]